MPRRRGAITQAILALLAAEPLPVRRIEIELARRGFVCGYLSQHVVAMKNRKLLQIRGTVGDQPKRFPGVRPNAALYGLPSVAAPPVRPPEGRRGKHYGPLRSAVIAMVTAQPFPAEAIRQRLRAARHVFADTTLPVLLSACVRDRDIKVIGVVEQFPGQFPGVVDRAKVYAGPDAVPLPPPATKTKTAVISAKPTQARPTSSGVKAPPPYATGFRW